MGVFFLELLREAILGGLGIEVAEAVLIGVEKLLELSATCRQCAVAKRTAQASPRTGAKKLEN